MSKDKLSIAAIIGFCGACIAFYIGAGFSTLQEVMQYDASYGSQFPIVILVVVVVYLYTNFSFATNGNRLKLDRGGDIYTAYCGKYIGKFFDWFAAFFCYMCFIVMCGGANSTLIELFGLYGITVPNGVGAVILTVLVVITGVFGLKGILNALGKLGPVIIVCIIIVCTISCFNVPAGSLEAGMAAVDSGQYSEVMKQVGGGNPWASGASYAGFVILWFAAFIAEIGARNDLKEVNIGMALSIIFIALTAAVASIALISHISEVSGAAIPVLFLANAISPAFAIVLAVIIFTGIYTTSVPLLWTGVKAVAQEGTQRYKIGIIVGGIIGCAVALFVDYKVLVNVLYGLNGYLGFILVAFMIIYDIRTRLSTKAAKDLVVLGGCDPVAAAAKPAPSLEGAPVVEAAQAAGAEGMSVTEVAPTEAGGQDTVRKE